MRSVAALLLALAAWTGSLATMSSSRCAMAAVRCEVRPCCAPKATHGPTLKPRYACCDVARAGTPTPAPAATQDGSASILALVPVTATLAPRVDRFDSFVAVATPRPRGPPLYLRNRSLLL